MECASDPDGLAAGVGALPRARRTAPASGLLALLAATALLALAAPAQAQTEIWSATLTPHDLGFGALGCNNTASNTAGECSNTAVLSDNDFTLGSTDHTIAIIELGPGTLQITVNPTSSPTPTSSSARTWAPPLLAFSRRHSRIRRR